MAVSWRGSGGGAQDDTAAAVACSMHGQMGCDVLTAETTRSERAGADEVHPSQSARWKKPVQTAGPCRCAPRLGKREQAVEALKAQRSRPLGPLQGEWAWRNHQAGVAPCGHVRPNGAGPSPALSLARQCPLGCGGKAWERALAAAQPELFSRAQGAP
jgi:hypothetical protein